MKRLLWSAFWKQSEYVRVLAQATLAVAGRDVADGQLTEVVASHLGLDLNGSEDLAVSIRALKWHDVPCRCRYQ